MKTRLYNYLVRFDDHTFAIVRAECVLHAERHILRTEYNKREIAQIRRITSAYAAKLRR